MPRTYFQSALHFGAYYGLAAFSFSAFLYFTLGNPLGPLSWLGVWIPIVFIVVAIKNHRDIDLGGYINYWEAYRTGFFTVVFGGVLFDVLMFLFGSLIAVDMLDDYKKMTIEVIQTLKNYPFFANYTDQLNEDIAISTLGTIVTNDYISKIWGAAFVSLIAAAILNKSKPAREDVN